MTRQREREKAALARMEESVEGTEWDPLETLRIAREVAGRGVAMMRENLEQAQRLYREGKISGRVLQQAYACLMDALAHQQKVQDEWLQRARRRAIAQRVRAEMQKRRQLYLQQYAALGPQYEALVEAVVRAETCAREMEALQAEGLYVGPTLWRTIGQEIRETVAALQKYTEVQKQEVVQREFARGVEVACQVLGTVIGEVQPALWEQGLARLSATLQEGEG
jgi:hypothetical protein